MIDHYFPTLVDLSLKAFYESVKECIKHPETVISFGDCVFLPEKITEKLITSLSSNGILNSRTLAFFNHKNTRLKVLKIPDASSIISTDLNIFNQHKFKEIHISNLSASVDELIESLDEWTCNNLEKLSVPHTKLSFFTRYSLVLTSISLLKNLRELNVSHTNFNVHNLDVIVEDLPKLESLNISYTNVNDVSPLLKCKVRLKTLMMANVELSPTREKSDESEEVDVLPHLTNLRRLDVSFEKDTSAFNTIIGPEPWQNFHLTNFIDKLPHLVSLDISGKEYIKEDDMIAFLRNHAKLKFLGLANTILCQSDVFLNPQNSDFRCDLKVAGTASLEQMIISMKLYETRTAFIQNSLYSLYGLSNRTELGARPDLIKLLTNLMRLHAKVFSIQLACSACLYNLTKSGLLDNDLFGIPSILMTEVAQLTLDAMERFPKHYQLQKNALLTLCNDRILQNTNMDGFRCAKLVLNALCDFNCETIERFCVAISSIVAAKISSEQMNEIGSHKRYMKKLLTMVKTKLDVAAADSTLGFTLSTLWNITDESPRTCEMFLKEGGLDLFANMLQEYVECDPVLTKILGLLNNIAEFPEFRFRLMKEELINSIRNLLRSDCIQISYFSAGVLAHLVSTGVKGWTTDKIPRESVLSELEESILLWNQIDSEMVAYRSFRPFLPLLECYETYQAQLWALWAMQHVLTVNAARYYRMLQMESVCDVFVTLIVRGDTNSLVRKQAQIIVNQLSDYGKKKISTFKF